MMDFDSPLGESPSAPPQVVNRQSAGRCLQSAGRCLQPAGRCLQSAGETDGGDIKITVTLTLPSDCLERRLQSGLPSRHIILQVN